MRCDDGTTFSKCGKRRKGYEGSNSAWRQRADGGRHASDRGGQLKVVKKTCENLADISCSGYEMAVVHGNGPQVGRLVLQQEIAAAEQPDQLPAIPSTAAAL